MKRYLFILVFLSLCVSIILVSCASMLPKPESPDDTLLVIIAVRDLSNLGGHVTMSFSHLELTIKGMDTPVRISGESYRFINNLAPGIHETVTIQEIYSDTYETHYVGSELKPASFRVPFVLKPGTITIFPAKFVLVTERTGEHQFSSGWDIKKITEDEKLKIINDLKGDENFKLWKTD